MLEKIYFIILAIFSYILTWLILPVAMCVYLFLSDVDANFKCKNLAEKKGYTFQYGYFTGCQFFNEGIKINDL